MRFRKQYKYSPSDFDIAGYRFFYHGAVFFVLMVVVRFFEIYMFSQNHFLSSGLFRFIPAGIFYDLIYTFQIGAILLIPYLVLYNISRKLGILFYSLSMYLIVLFNLLLTFYFSERFIPVDYHIFENEFVAWIAPFMNVYVFAAACAILLLAGMGLVMLVRNLRIPRLVYIATYCLAILSLIFYFRLFPKPNNFYNELNYYVVINKSNYILYSALDNRFPNSSTSYSYAFNLDADSNHFREGKLNMLSPKYPFLRPKDSFSVLDKYILNSNKPPLIILIVVENLSRTFTGEHATIGSFSPFLDSVYRNGLNWENFLSNSLDPGSSLHIILNSTFPCPGKLQGISHFSIIDILKQNNYPAYFYTNLNSLPDESGLQKKPEKFMKILLKNQIIQGNKMNINSFYNSVAGLISSKAETPSIHIIYQAYQPPEKESVVFKKYLLDLQKKDNDIAAINKYPKIINYIFETDKGIALLYSKLGKSGVMNNSLLIITGANHPLNVPLDNRIRKYYVPFVMISPLIKSHFSFQGISTHMNITPALSAYFEFHYGFKVPPYLPFSGGSLSDNIFLSAQNSIPFQGMSGQINEYLLHNTFYSQGHIYRVLKRMGLREITNNEELQQAKSLLNEYNSARNYVCRQNKIMPDSIPVN